MGESTSLAVGKGSLFAFQTLQRNKPAQGGGKASVINGVVHLEAAFGLCRKLEKRNFVLSTNKAKDDLSLDNHLSEMV